ncbi:MAG: hypothetical protein V3T52_04555 [Thermodesulfobacteriota bacterium]|jgi:hypothetical protein
MTETGFPIKTFGSDGLKDEMLNRSRIKYGTWFSMTEKGKGASAPIFTGSA